MTEYIQQLNDKYASQKPSERIKMVFDDFGEDKVLVTSSFGTSSVYLLSLIREVMPDKEIFFIDTSYHFRETYVYKEYLTSYFNLNVVDLMPHKFEHDYTRVNKLWETDPDRCCDINKVSPLEQLKKEHHVWISGLMKFQNNSREKKQLFEQNGILRFHPVIDVSRDFLQDFVRKHNLPQHPLAVNGYDSIGCTHCTIKGKDRSGRWLQFQKTECGLHDDYFKVK